MSEATKAELDKSEGLTKAEKEKLTFEFFKHLSVMNSTIIVLLASLLQNIFKHPNKPAEVWGTFTFFGFSLFFSMFVMYLIVDTDSKNNLGRIISVLAAVIFFFIGLIQLYAVSGNEVTKSLALPNSEQQVQLILPAGPDPNQPTTYEITVPAKVKIAPSKSPDSLPDPFGKPANPGPTDDKDQQEGFIAPAPKSMQKK